MEIRKQTQNYLYFHFVSNIVYLALQFDGKCLLQALPFHLMIFLSISGPSNCFFFRYPRPEIHFCWHYCGFNFFRKFIERLEELMKIYKNKLRVSSDLSKWFLKLVPAIYLIYK